MVHVFVLENKSITPRMFERAAFLYAKLSHIEHWDGTLNRHSRGKPYFVNMPDVHFSLTHSGDIWACAFARKPIGLDVEQVRDSDSVDMRGIAKRFFHPLEMDYLIAHAYEPFFQIWTAKESYVKYTGEGISESFSKFSVVNEEGLLDTVQGARLQALDISSVYKGALCGEYECARVLQLSLGEEEY